MSRTARIAVATTAVLAWMLYVTLTVINPLTGTRFGVAYMVSVVALCALYRLLMNGRDD